MRVTVTHTQWSIRHLQPRARQVRLAVTVLACLVAGIGWIEVRQEFFVSDVTVPHRHDGPLEFDFRIDFIVCLVLISLIAGQYLIPKRAFAAAFAVVCTGFAYSFATYLASKATGTSYHETTTAAYGFFTAALYGFVILPSCLSSMAIGSGFTLILERSKV